MRYHATYKKDPDAIQPVTINWEPFISHTDTLATATTTAYTKDTTTVTTDITIDSTTITNTTTTTVLSGGVSDTDYDIRVRAVTTAGYADDRTVRVKVRQK